MVAVQLYADHLTTATAEQFQRYAARTREEVEGSGIFKVDVLHQHVEDVLLGEVRRGTGLERTGYVEVAPLIFSSNNSHNLEH